MIENIEIQKKTREKKSLLNNNKYSDILKKKCGQTDKTTDRLTRGDVTMRSKTLSPNFIIQ